MGADIISFANRQKASRGSDVHAERVEFRATGRQRAGRKRNPLRYPCTRVDYAVTIAGKLQRGEPTDDLIDDIAVLRRGAEQARYVAAELERLIEQYGEAVPS